MRASLQIDPKERSRVTLFFDHEELSGTDAVRYEGTLADGLTVHRARLYPTFGEMTKARHFKLTKATWGAVARLPPENNGAQPYGRTYGALKLQVREAQPTAISFEPFTFPEEMMRPKDERLAHRKPPAERKKKEVKEPELPWVAAGKVTAFGIPEETVVQVVSYRTPDGALFEDIDQARAHIQHVKRMEKFHEVEGAGIRRFSVDNAENENCMMILKDGRVLTFLATGSKHARLSIAVNGEEL